MPNTKNPTPDEIDETVSDAPTPAPAPDIWDQKVTIKIPKDRTTKEDVPVTINDRTFLIQRGVSVDVPRPVYEALLDQERAIAAQDAYIEANAS